MVLVSGLFIVDYIFADVVDISILYDRTRFLLIFSLLPFTLHTVSAVARNPEALFGRVSALPVIVNRIQRISAFVLLSPLIRSCGNDARSRLLSMQSFYFIRSLYVVEIL